MLAFERYFSNGTKC